MNKAYNIFFEKLMDGKIDLDTNNIYCALFKATYVPLLTHIHFEEIKSYEASGTGYTPYGKLLTGRSLVNKKFDASDVVWIGVTLTDIKYAVIYKKDGPLNSWLICYMDFDDNRSITNGTFPIEFNSSGILYFV